MGCEEVRGGEEERKDFVVLYIAGFEKDVASSYICCVAIRLLIETVA